MVAVLSGIAIGLAGSGCGPNTTTADRLARAERFFQTEAYESAEIEYLNVLKADPKNAVAVARLGIICQAQGQWPKALSFLQRATAVDANNVDVHRALALTYVTMHQNSLARDEAEFVLGELPADHDAVLVLVDAARDPREMEEARQRLRELQLKTGERAVFYVGLGELSLRQKDLKSAEVLFGKALSLDDQSSVVHAALARLYLAKTNLAEGERALKRAADLAPLRSFVRLKWADFKAKTGHLDEAKRFLEEIADKAPGYTPVLNRLAQIAFEQRKYDECSAVLRRVLTADPLGFDGRLLSAKLKLAQGQAPKAVEELERLVSWYPKAPIVPYQLALAQLVNGNIAKAVNSLNQAVTLDPSYADAVLLLAELNARRGDAVSAITSLTGLLKSRPQLPQAHYALAEAYRIRGTPDDAVAVYRRLMQMFPKDAQAPFFLGLILRQQKKIAEARQSFEKALEIEPSFLRAVIQLVEMDLEKPDHAAALERAQQYTARYPTKGEPQFLLAQVYLAKSDNLLAEQALLKTIELQPDFSQGYVVLARLMVASGRQRQAMEKLEALLTRNPKEIGALMLLGMLHEQTGNVSKAKGAYDKLLDVNPRFGPALNNAANLYAQKLGQVQKGLELARRARDQAPFDPYTADTLGWILFQRGDYPTAVALLQESAQKLPTEPEVLYHLGMAHYMMGEEAPARTFLERAAQAKSKDYAGKAQVEHRLAIINLDPAKADSGAVALLDRRLSERPDDPIAVSRMAALHVRNGQPDKAIKICEQALKSNPDVVRLLVQLAELYSEHRRDPSRALEYARNARTVAPDDPQVAYSLGRVAFQSRAHKWAYSLLQDAAHKHPDQGEILAPAAWAAYSVGQVTEAESLMQRAVQSGGGLSSSDAARRFLAMCALYLEPAKIPAATAQLQEALAGNPDDVPTLMAVGMAHQQRKNVEDARKAFERVLALYPEFTPAMKLLAGIYAEQGGNDRRAYELASKAREAFPGDADLLRTLGILAYRRGDFVSSVRLLGPVSLERTNDASVFFHLGMAHHRLKAIPESQRALRRALALDANSPLAADARKALVRSN